MWARKRLNLTAAKDDPEVRKRKARLKAIADTTMQDINRGSIYLSGYKYDLATGIDAMARRTQYYSPSSTLLSSWSLRPTPPMTAYPSSYRATPLKHTQIYFYEITTLEGCRELSNILSASHSADPRLGVLNFACATHPGGGFLHVSRSRVCISCSIISASPRVPGLRRRA
jgi:hypothetical protein